MKLCNYNYNIISMNLLGMVRTKITDLFTPDAVYIMILRAEAPEKGKSKDYIYTSYIDFIKKHQQTRFRHRISVELVNKFDENFNVYTFDSTKKTIEVGFP
jgi:hypothetical protein